MTKYKIVVDSTADFSQEEAAKFGIEVVPLKIVIDGVEFIDGVDFTPEEFLVKMAESAELPSSSQPAPGVFAEVYEKIKSEGATPIAILLSQKLSGTYQSGVIGCQLADIDALVIDSKLASVPVKKMAIEAAKMAEEGKSIEEIKARIEETIENTQIYVGLKTVENLVKGGRLSKTKGTITSILNIKPIIKFEDGALIAHDKVRGFPAISKYLLQKVKAASESQEVTHVGIIHVGNEADAIKLKNEITSILPEVEAEMVDTTAVLARHLGAGALAVTITTK